jgi:competence protein ComEA
MVLLYILKGVFMKILLVMLFSIGLLFASVDINKANQKEFTTLSGVGAKKAANIVAFRDKNGCFKKVDELSKVKGIGKKTIEKNKEILTLTPCK